MSGVFVIVSLICWSCSLVSLLFLPVYGVGLYFPVFWYLFHIRLMVRSLMLNHFLICATGSFRCFAAMMSTSLSSEIGLTTKRLLTNKHYKHTRQYIFKLLYSCNLQIMVKLITIQNYTQRHKTNMAHYPRLLNFLTYSAKTFNLPTAQ